MGGAVDLSLNCKQVIIAMEHSSKDGVPKFLDECTLPLTGKQVVDMAISELAVFRKINGELVLTELAEGVSKEKV